MAITDTSIIETVRIHFAEDFEAALSATDAAETSSGAPLPDLLQGFRTFQPIDYFDEPPEIPLQFLDGVVVFRKTYPAPSGDIEPFLLSHFKGRDFEDE